MSSDAKWFQRHAERQKSIDGLVRELDDQKHTPQGKLTEKIIATGLISSVLILPGIAFLPISIPIASVMLGIGLVSSGGVGWAMFGKCKGKKN